jgi:hypothetical protein
VETQLRNKGRFSWRFTSNKNSEDRFAGGVQQPPALSHLEPGVRNESRLRGNIDTGLWVLLEAPVIAMFDDTGGILVNHLINI